jgi:DNA-binding NarL/FixJ family response regulator
MAKPSKKSRRVETSPPAVELALRLAPRRASAERRLRILERLTCGLTVAHIARLEDLTVHRVRQIIAGMLEKRELDPQSELVQL